MKKTVFLLLIVMFANCSSDDSPVPEKVFEGEVMLITQEEVNEFGKQNYTLINGALYINEIPSSLDKIVDLTPLKNIKSVIDLTVGNTTLLKNLNGLSNLKEISGVFNLVENDALENIDDLKILAKANMVNIVSNGKLSSIQGFRNLKNTAIVAIKNNDALLNLEGLENIEEVQTSITILDNDNLNSLKGLDNLEAVSWLIVSRNGIESLNGLEKLANTERLYIESNTNLVSIDALSSLSSVHTTLHIIANKKLVEINAINGSVKNSTRIVITENITLTNLCGLQLHSLSDYIGEYIVSDNGYNPTQQNLIDQNCSL